MVLPHRLAYDVAVPHATSISELLTPFSPEWEREKSTNYFLAKAFLTCRVGIFGRCR